MTCPNCAENLSSVMRNGKPIDSCWLCGFSREKDFQGEKDDSVQIRNEAIEKTVDDFGENTESFDGHHPFW
jgi:hypothetical protein